ncbi:MAG: hypothetical protein MUF50_02070 [Planctomycetes bacterium]|jgi:hypothetical protein|nr:hypothetical protein [Planctomycetota bacterium]
MKFIINHLKWRHETFYKKNKLHLAADIVLLSAILILVVVFFVVHQVQLAEKAKIVISANETQISSGKLTDFNFAYEIKKATSNSILKINLPDNFILKNSSPEQKFDNNTLSFALGNLKKGDKGQVKISGIVLGEKGSQQVITSNFNCTECGYGYINSLFYAIENSELNISIETPEKIYEDALIPVVLVVRNNGSEKIESLNLRLSNNWLITNKEYTNNSLALNSLASGEERRIPLVIKKESNGPLYLESFLPLAEKQLKQSVWEKEIIPLKSNLEISTSINKEAVSFNEELIINLQLKNNNDSEVKEIVINDFNLDDGLVIKKIDLPKKYLKNGGIFINQLQAKTEIILPINLIIKNDNAQTRKTNLKSHLSYEIDGQKINANLNSSDIKFLVDLNPTANIYYYNSYGDQLGIGPLPPVVDIPTTYWVFWEIRKPDNNTEKAKFTALLAKNVVLTGKQIINQGSLNNDYNRLSWDIGTLDKNQNYQAKFEIQITPSAENLGQEPLLLTDIKFTANDSLTNKTITQNFKDVSTVLANDSFAQDKGKVVE